MKATLRIFSTIVLSALATSPLWAQATPSSTAPCAAAMNGDFPKAVLSNGAVQAVIYLPDPQKGYYRSTRFDWSGVVACLAYKGHTYFGVWFNHYDPLINDAITGPVEEFRSSDGLSSINYDEAKPGDLFFKPGVGMLRKVDNTPYKFGTLYPLVDAGKWTVKVKKTEVIFTHRLQSPSGYSYVYEKILKLGKNEPTLTLEHHMKNTGSRPIDSQVYDHDFFMLDGVPTGPGMVAHFPFEPQPQRDLGPRGKIEGKDIAYLEELQPRQSVASYLKGYSDKPSDYDFIVENKNTGVGVEQTSDSPIATLNFWSIRTVICPEAYIRVNPAPGQSKSWTIHYRFFAR
jgi:hypothetical protein